MATILPAALTLVGGGVQEGASAYCGERASEAWARGACGREREKQGEG